MNDQPSKDQLAEIHMAAKRLGSEIPSPDSGRIDIWIDEISSVYNRLQYIAVDGDASSEQVGTFDFGKRSSGRNLASPR